MKYFVIAFLFFACLPDREKCSASDFMRCSENATEECLDGVWVEEDDCSAVNLFSGEMAAWQCCDYGDDGAYCEPVCGAK